MIDTAKPLYIVRTIVGESVVGDTQDYLTADPDGGLRGLFTPDDCRDYFETQDDLDQHLVDVHVALAGGEFRRDADETLWYHDDNDVWYSVDEEDGFLNYHADGPTATHPTNPADLDNLEAPMPARGFVVGDYPIRPVQTHATDLMARPTTPEAAQTVMELENNSREGLITWQSARQQALLALESAIIAETRRREAINGPLEIVEFVRHVANFTTYGDGHDTYKSERQISDDEDMRDTVNWAIENARAALAAWEAAQ